MTYLCQLLPLMGNGNLSPTRTTAQRQLCMTRKVLAAQEAQKSILRRSVHVLLPFRQLEHDLLEPVCKTLQQSSSLSAGSDLERAHCKQPLVETP